MNGTLIYPFPDVTNPHCRQWGITQIINEGALTFNVAFSNTDYIIQVTCEAVNEVAAYCTVVTKSENGIPRLFCTKGAGVAATSNAHWLAVGV